MKGFCAIFFILAALHAVSSLAYGDKGLRFEATLSGAQDLFGAGYFQETLVLAAHCPNVFIDTSSANGWTRYMPYPMDLRLVFERALDAVGPERIIFGTDSSHFPRGFLWEILEEQTGILNTLGVSKADAQLIMGGNIAVWGLVLWWVGRGRGPPYQGATESGHAKPKRHPLKKPSSSGAVCHCASFLHAGALRCLSGPDLTCLWVDAAQPPSG
jgi:Amidohydrolase